MAESILPDARRLAGQDGMLILVEDVVGGLVDVLYDRVSTNRAHTRLLEGEAESYLEGVAERLRSEGVLVEVHTLDLIYKALAINEAAKLDHADFIACATHGRSVLGRLVRGSVAWKVLAMSSVPVLLRHPESVKTTPMPPGALRRILVPLDGSELGEKALPFARELAKEWNASLSLIRVVPDPFMTFVPYAANDPPSRVLSQDVEEANAYLVSIGHALGGGVNTNVVVGDVVAGITKEVAKQRITDVVMASHGRTGLSRVLSGSVADALIHELHCPILVVPALAVQSVEVPAIQKQAENSLVSAGSH
jgi:nucleotide-binding universal stress UspA family protein